MAEERRGEAPPATEASSRTGYGFNPRDRQSGRRDDAAFVADLWGAPTTRCLVFSGDVIVMSGDVEAPDPLFARPQVEARGWNGERAFLGTDDDGALFATRLPDGAAPDAPLFTIDLRTTAIGGLLPPSLVGALGQAKTLLGWHARHRFCPNCGAPTRTASAGWRRVCETCDTQHFPRVDPVVIMLVADGARCLLGRSPRFPPNFYSCLAGFIEPGETAEDAVRREIMEEAGIGVGRVAYHATQSWPFPGALMLGFLAEAASVALTVDHSELEDARWFPRDEVRLMLARSHPDGLICPQPVAIAHTLLTHWAAL